MFNYFVIVTERDSKFLRARVMRAPVGELPGIEFGENWTGNGWAPQMSGPRPRFYAKESIALRVCRRLARRERLRVGP